MIFADMGVNPTKWGYSAYDDIIQKLVAGGIPREQIAAIGDAESDAKKQALFEKVRQGSVRVLIGSTQKMGTGTNVQKRLVALHHLDAPWKPAEVEQREGRILRQGNTNEEVAVYRYVTEGSFDAYMWQALETKARFISQVITGNNALRRAEDIGGQELSYAEVKAIASGNPAVLTLAEADAELQRLTLLKKNHLDEQYVARLNVRDLPTTIAKLSDRLSKLTDDRDAATANPGDGFSDDSNGFFGKHAMDMFGKQLESLPKAVLQTQRISLGVFHGLNYGVILHPQFPPEVYIKGAIQRTDTLSRDHHGPRAILNGLARLAGSYRSSCDSARKELTIAESQLRDYQLRLGIPFLHDDYLSELTSLRDQLKIGLSAIGQAADESGPSVSELAEKVRSHKAVHSVESTSQRTPQKHSTAEEPITARIRRRAEAVPASEQALPAYPASPAGADLSAESSKDSSGKPSLTYLERIAMERQEKETPENML